MKNIYPMHRTDVGLFHLRKPLPKKYVPKYIEVRYNITEKIEIKRNTCWFPVHPAARERNRLLITNEFLPWPWGE